MISPTVLAEKFVLFAEPFRPFRIHSTKGPTVDAVDRRLLVRWASHSFAVYVPPV